MFRTNPPNAVKKKRSACVWNWDRQLKVRGRLDSLERAAGCERELNNKYIYIYIYVLIKIVRDVTFPYQVGHSQFIYFLRPDSVIHETGICSPEWENTQSDCTVSYTKMYYMSCNMDLEVQGKQIICWLDPERGINYLNLWTSNTKWKGIAQSVLWPSPGSNGQLDFSCWHK